MPDITSFPISTIKVGDLPPVGVTGASIIPHEISGQLKRDTVTNLTAYISGVIGATDAIGFLPISVEDGDTLPALPANPGFFLAPAGTFINVGGAPNIVTTEKLNAIMTDPTLTFWVLSVEIPIDTQTEYIGISQVITNGVVDLAPSEDAVFDALEMKQNQLVAGTNVTIDVTDPLNPIISSTGGGGGSGTSLTETITAGENLVSGNLVYLKSDGKWWKADNLDVTKCSTELRIATATIAANATGNSIAQGQFTTTGLRTGFKYFVGTNGSLINAVPETEGIFERYIGTALSTTVLEFNPDPTYIEITLVPAPSGVGLKFENLASSSYVTSTTSETILTSLPVIPGNTFVPNQRWELSCLLDRFINVGACVVKLYINSSVAISGATLLGTYTMPAGVGRAIFKREFPFKSGTIAIYPTGTSAVNDDGESAVGSGVSIAYTTNKYMFITVTPADSGDAVRSYYIQLIQK